MEDGGLCYVYLSDYTNRKEVIVTAKFKEQLIARWVLIARPRWWKDDGYYSSIEDIVETIRLMDIQSISEFWRCIHYSQFSDMYKDVVGYRPRHIHWKDYSIKQMKQEMSMAIDIYGSPFEEE